MGNPLDSDAFLALRRLRRHLTVWRVLAVIGFAIAIFVVARDAAVLPAEDHVARVAVEGVIVRDDAFLQLLSDIEEDPTARALVVEITSPGGTFTGGEALFRALRRVADEKPVVAVMGELATSGGYMAAIGADHIIAGQGTITGSIGVIMQSASITGLLEKLGIEPQVIKSGASKATPNPFEDLQPQQRAQLQAIIDEIHTAFVDMVAERRPLTPAEVRDVSGDGRIFTGATAAEIGLIDGIGDVNDARLWLSTSHDVSEDLPLYDWVVEEPPFAFLEDGAASLSQLIFGKSLFPERLRLDGIQALWHPSFYSEP